MENIRKSRLEIHGRKAATSPPKLEAIMEDYYCQVPPPPPPPDPPDEPEGPPVILT